MSSDRGQVTVFVVGWALVAIAMAAFAIDGTRAFLMRRTLQNAADASALAGASELDAGAYYASGGSRIRVDPASAEQVAERWLVTRGLAADADIAADAEGVAVVLRREMPTTLLSMIGVRSIPVAVEATAQPISRPAGTD